MKNREGITLIALVITIVVLIILAGITINLTIGENGILSKAKKAKEDMNFAAAYERVNLKIIEANTEKMSTDGRTCTLKELEEYLAKEEQIDIVIKSYNKEAYVDTRLGVVPANLENIVVQIVGYEQYSFLIGKTIAVEKVSKDDGNTFIDIADFSPSNSEIQTPVYERYEFAYKNEEQKFIAQYTGTYKIECWGAAGGTADANNPGGNGAYVSGYIKLNKGTELFIYTGGKGVDNVTSSNYLTSGGFNGGGYGSYGYPCAGGGGATDVRTESNNINSRIIVAAGGGGDTSYRTNIITAYGKGGDAGGLQGYNGQSNYNSNYLGFGGTQISGGSGNGTNHYGSFYQGCNSPVPSDDRAGGGGGWYGGRSLIW